MTLNVHWFSFSLLVYGRKLSGNSWSFTSLVQQNKRHILGTEYIYSLLLSKTVNVFCVLNEETRFEFDSCCKPYPPLWRLLYWRNC